MRPSVLNEGVKHIGKKKWGMCRNSRHIPHFFYSTILSDSKLHYFFLKVIFHHFVENKSEELCRG